MIPFGFESKACTACFEVVAPHGLVVGVACVFEVSDVEVAVIRVSVGIMDLQAPLKRELLEDRVAFVLVEGEG